jgi:hypothetical protein
MKRVAKGRALQDHLRTLIVPRNCNANREVSASLQQQFNNRNTCIFPLGYGMKDGRLSADAGIVDSRTRVDVSSQVEEEPNGFQILVLRRHVQQRRTLQRQHAASGRPEYGIAQLLLAIAL